VVIFLSYLVTKIENYGLYEMYREDCGDRDWGVATDAEPQYTFSSRFHVFSQTIHRKKFNNYIKVKGFLKAAYSLSSVF